MRIVKKPRSWWITSLVVLLLLGAYFAVSSFDRKMGTPALGRLAPPFRALLLSSAPPISVAPMEWLTPEMYQGKTVLLNFWASWCTSCRTEADLLNRLQTEYGSQTFILVGLATSDDPVNAITTAHAMGHRYLIAFDRDDLIAREFEVGSLPQTFLIDTHGRIRYHVQGPLQDSHWAGLTQAIRQAQAAP